jgi:hypothetical protein
MPGQKNDFSLTPPCRDDVAKEIREDELHYEKQTQNQNDALQDTAKNKNQKRKQKKTLAECTSCFAAGPCQQVYNSLPTQLK